MINTDTGACPFPLCIRASDKGSSYCVFHRKYFDTPNPKKSKQPIATESVKRKKEKKVLAVIKKDKMIELNGECQLRGANCTGKATDYEHIQKSSPSNYIDPKNGTIACRNCNRDKELHPELFKQHSVSRFAK